MDDNRKKALAAALSQIEKQFGKGSVMRMGDASAVRDIEVISTGSLSLDLALGIGGLPKGRVVEIYGPESSGKTTMTLHVVAEAQKSGGTCAFVDAEHALDPVYAEKLGVDMDELLVSQPDTGEQALEITDMLVRSGAVDVVVVDLRMLGVAMKDQSIATISVSVRPWLIGALAVMLGTGVLLFLSEAIKCFYNTSFWVKIITLPFAIAFTFGVRERMVGGRAPQQALQVAGRLEMLRLGHQPARALQQLRQRRLQRASGQVIEEDSAQLSPPISLPDRPHNDPPPAGSASSHPSARTADGPGREPGR